eukprot:2043136-Amphidinium_carterae.1
MKNGSDVFPKGLESLRVGFLNFGPTLGFFEGRGISSDSFIWQLSNARYFTFADLLGASSSGGPETWKALGGWH